MTINLAATKVASNAFVYTKVQNQAFPLYRKCLVSARWGPAPIPGEHNVLSNSALRASAAQLGIATEESIVICIPEII